MSKRGIVLFGAVVGALLAGGCNSQDAERLARIGRKAVARVNSIGSGADGKIASGWRAIRLSMDELTADARVSARLRWDKSLADTQVEIRGNGTTVELRGKVRDLAQRRRAVELAESTTGVEKVVDTLEIAPPVTN